MGATIGGLLSRAGHDVVLVARGAHAAAMATDGLRLARPEGLLTLRLPVVELAELALQPGDVLLLAVKSQDSAAVLGVLAGLPVMARTAGEVLPVLCVQNGVSNEPEALRRFASVHGVCLMLPATHLEPGHVVSSGAPLAGLLEIGRYPYGVDAVDEQVAADLTGSGFAGTARADVMAWKRAKLLRNLGNAIEALGGHDLDDEGLSAVRELDRRARGEGQECFAAAGLAYVPDEEWDAHRGNRSEVVPVDGRTRGGGSTWQSLRRGTGSVEADHLNGEVVLLGRLHGVPTPVNALLQREVNALSRSGGAAGSVPPAQLLARVEPMGTSEALAMRGSGWDGDLDDTRAGAGPRS